jgi:hypothetical protein
MAFLLSRWRARPANVMSLGARLGVMYGLERRMIDNHLSRARHGKSYISSMQRKKREKHASDMRNTMNREAILWRTKYRQRRGQVCGFCVYTAHVTSTRGRGSGSVAHEISQVRGIKAELSKEAAEQFLGVRLAHVICFLLTSECQDRGHNSKSMIYHSAVIESCADTQYHHVSPWWV